jgi:hypothetical protein
MQRRKEATRLKRRNVARAARAEKRRFESSNAIAAFAKAEPAGPMETGNIHDGLTPEHASAARLMDEQARRWNATAHRAIGSICRGC